MRCSSLRSPRPALSARAQPSPPTRSLLTPARYRQESRAGPPPPARAPDREQEDDLSSSSSSPALDVLRAAIPISTFDRTEKALSDWCSSKPSAEAREQCLQVLRYYREKRAAAQQGCLRELEEQSASASPARSPSPSAAVSSLPACATLAQLERLMHETSYSGDPAYLYQVLAAQRAAEARLGEQQPHDAAASAAAHSTAAAADALRLRALRLFHLADSDGDAKLDREEFLAAMRLMDAELSDAELGAVFSALDARCSLTAEQFVDAVTGESQLAAALAEASVDDEGGEEADEEGHVARRGRAFLRRHVHRSGAGGGEAAAQHCDADVLRRVRHSRPTWWSDAPGYLEMIS